MSGVPAHDVRQHDRNGHAVRRVVVSGQGVGARMRRAEHRLLDRDARLVGAEEHGAASLEIVRLDEDALVVLFEQPPCLAGEQIRHRGARRRHVRLDRV